jgi:uncharacterized protein YcaQ
MQDSSTVTQLSLAQARRIALGAQGFTDPRPKGRVDARHFRRVMDRMRILQLDSVNVLCRSHFLPVFARVGAYDRDRLDHWIWRSGENHEYLSHEASITSVDLYPLLRHRMATRGSRRLEALAEKDAAYLAAVVDEIEQRGPLSVSDLSEPGGRTGPWWGHSKGKVALHGLYVAGRLSVHERTKTFLTIYDLPDRTIPGELLRAPEIELEEVERQMLLMGAKAHGIGTAADLADYFRLKMPRARPQLAALVDDGLLELVEVEGWKEPAYLHPEATRPRSIDARALLSPFDPVVWFRPRAERLFDFHYRIEIYVPEPKRVHGYYVLPFLLGDELVARVDLKADRKTGHLLAKAAFLEPGQDPDIVAPAMAQTLQEMAQWLGLDAVRVGRRGDLARALASASR